MKAIDARMFLLMLRGAAERLDAEKERVNALNVFPVPDGDTGTNMALTLGSALKAAEECGGDHLGRISEAAARGALLGARGNSGVILSQFFRGLADGLKGLVQADTYEIVRAFESAAKAAYKAVLKPVEGTMLSVGRAGAEAAREAAERGLELSHVLVGAFEGARRMLAETPKFLDVLREAGVVDAGGEGLLVAAYGGLGALQNGTAAALAKVEQEQTVAAAPVGASLSTSSHTHGIRVTEDITYKYCTEFLVHGDSLVPEQVKEQMLTIKGDSLLVVGDTRVVKVHVHTNEPWKALETAASIGELSAVSVGNMVLQNLDAGSGGEAQSEANGVHAHGHDVTEQETEAKPIGVVAVVQGSGFERMLRDLGVDRFIEGGQSMNPSTQEMLDAVEAVNAPTVILLPNNHNVMMAAEQVVRLSEKQVFVLPTDSMPEAVAAMMSFNADAEVETLVDAMREAIGAVRVGEVTHAVRDANVNGLKIREGQVIGLTGGQIVGVGDTIEAAVRPLVEHMLLDGAEIITVYRGAEATADEAEALVKHLEAEFEECEVEVYEGGQPVYRYLITVE